MALPIEKYVPSKVTTIIPSGNSLLIPQNNERFNATEQGICLQAHELGGRCAMRTRISEELQALTASPGV